MGRTMAGLAGVMKMVTCPSKAPRENHSDGHRNALVGKQGRLGRCGWWLGLLNTKTAVCLYYTGRKAAL